MPRRSNTCGRDGAGARSGCAATGAIGVPGSVLWLSETADDGGGRGVAVATAAAAAAAGYGGEADGIGAAARGNRVVCSVPVALLAFAAAVHVYLRVRRLGHPATAGANGDRTYGGGTRASTSATASLVWDDRPLGGNARSDPRPQPPRPRRRLANCVSANRDGHGWSGRGRSTDVLVARQLGCAREQRPRGRVGNLSQCGRRARGPLVGSVTQKGCRRRKGAGAGRGRGGSAPSRPHPWPPRSCRRPRQ